MCNANERCWFADLLTKERLLTQGICEHLSHVVNVGELEPFEVLLFYFSDVTLVGGAKHDLF